MLKNLLVQCPSSPVILDMCCTLLNFKLSKTLNDGVTMQFWLFTMRAVAQDNPSLDKLKQLLVKFGGFLSSGPVNAALGAQSSNNSVAFPTTIKRDYIFIEFLKVAKEAVLLDMFTAFEEAAQLSHFAAYKFQSEVEREKKATEGSASASGESSGYDSDSGSSYDSGMNEKKELLV